MADIFLKQQKRNAENINLVTPTSYVTQIVEAIDIARKRGLNLPIIYNTNGYEDVQTLKELKGYIDIYMPDFKYAENSIAKKLSNVDNYFEIATQAIKVALILLKKRYTISTVKIIPRNISKIT